MTIFLVFLLGYVLSQFFRSFLAVIAPELSAELGLDAAELGTVSSAWFVTFAAAQFGVGPALDRIGPKRTVAVTMIAAVLGSLLFATAKGAGTATLAMALIGLGCSAVYMGALYTFARTADPARFATLASTMIGLGSLGNLLGATPLAFAAETIGWRPTFVVIAAVTALSALLVALILSDPPAPKRSEGGTWEGLVSLLATRRLWPIIPMAFVSYAVVATERGLWIGPYFSDVFGFDQVSRGNAVMAMAVAMSLGALFYGPLDRLLGTRKWVALSGTLIAGVAFVWLAAAPSTSAIGAAMLLAAVGFFGLNYGVVMAHSRAFFSEDRVGQGLAVMNFLFIGGAAALQPLSGVLMDGWEEGGAEPAEAYASLHLLFGFALIAVSAIYAFSNETAGTGSDRVPDKAGAEAPPT